MKPILRYHPYFGLWYIGWCPATYTTRRARTALADFVCQLNSLNQRNRA